MYDQKKKLIKESKWDSDIFNKKVGIVNLKSKLSHKEIVELKKEIEEYDLVVAKDFTYDFKNSKTISTILNGYIVDLNVQFSKKNLIRITKENPVSFILNDKKKMSEKDKSKITLIAGSAFEHSRFYNDQNIENSIANNIFENWIKDSFENDNKQFIFYKLDEDVLGFLLYSVNDAQKELIIELVAVDKNSIARGIGKSMVSHFEDSFSFEKYKEYSFKVGTQVNNINAMNFYMKNDYKMLQESRTYHIWNANDETKGE